MGDRLGFRQSIAVFRQYESEEGIKAKNTLEEFFEAAWNLYEKKGMEGILGTRQLPDSFAKVRKQDFYACCYRYRGFKRI